MKKKFRIFYTTCGSAHDAKKIAKLLLKEKSATCVNIIEKVKSFYNENGSIYESDEIILIIKSSLNKKNMEKVLGLIHPYDIPIIVEISCNEPNEKYFEWFSKNSI